MASRRWRSVVLAVLSGLISTLFVAGPTTAVASDPASMSMSVAAVRTENDVVSIDLTGTTGENASLYLLLGPDNGKPCGATIGTWYGVQPQPYWDGWGVHLTPGSFSQHFDKSVMRQSGFYDDTGGFLKACAYLLYQSDGNPTTYIEDQTPRATAAAYHISSVVPCSPEVDFTIDEAVQLQSVTPEGGTAALRVTIPQPGYVSAAGDDHGRFLEDGVFFGKHLEAGTHWIRTTPPDSAKAIFKEQKPKTERFTVSFVSDEQSESLNTICLKPDDSFVDSRFDGATRTRSIEWTPGTDECHQVGCPSQIVTGCYTIDMTCYERTLTLDLTKKAWSGTIMEPGGGSHCRGTGKKYSWVFLWQLDKGKWFQIASVKASNGTYAGKFTSGYLKGKMKKGGSFQATIGDGAISRDYTCASQVSDLKKLPAG